jgi:exopolysaccharide biosynthesis protein
VGWSATHIYLITVDGRQPGLSVGMKLAELAEYMVKLGCIDAMNLDGGKSAQMWLAGRIVNDPCQGEDTVANSLLVVRKPGGR